MTTATLPAIAALLDVTRYDRAPELSLTEQQALARFALTHRDRDLVLVEAEQDVNADVDASRREMVTRGTTFRAPTCQRRRNLRHLRGYRASAGGALLHPVTGPIDRDDLRMV